MKTGIFIVIDGLDGIGKGVCLDTLKLEAQKSGLEVFDVNRYWSNYDRIPSLDEIGDVDILMTSEPTYQGLGKYIREVLVSNSEEPFSTSIVAQAYSLDREILYRRLIIPARNRGISIFQSRSVSTSIAYQKITGRGDGVNLRFILSLPGNKLALENTPDYLIIPTITNVQEVMNRLENRNKEDNCLFENLEFQLKVKKEYESEKFKKIFEDRGTNILYVDVGQTVEYTQEQISDLFTNEFYDKIQS